MSFTYVEEDVPNTPYPFIAGWGILADLWGQQAFRGPIRGYRGNVRSPTYTFDAENRTGWYQPWENSIGAAIAGFLRFHIDETGTTYWNTLGFGGTVAADLITENRIYQLPDRSGTLALEANIESTIAEYMTVNVSNFATIVLAANPLRLGLSITNQGEIDVYVGFSADLVAGDLSVADGGTLLTPKGGNFSLETIRYTGPVYAITADSSTVLGVIEYLP